MTPEERQRIEASAGRMSLPFAIEFAGPEEGDGDEFRVMGWMNTFRVTHSGRLLDQRDFQTWLKKNPGATVPMLANHGGNSESFNTIGVWDSFEFHAGKGMLWGGRVAKGTALADEARLLLGQKVLQQLSVRLNPTASRKWVKANDHDLPKEIVQAIVESGESEVLLHQNWWPLEGSIVDVADDAGARTLSALAAEQLAPLSAQLAEITAKLAEPRDDAAKGGDLAERVMQAVATQLTAFLEEFKQDALLQIEVLAADPDAAYAEELLSDQADALSGDLGAHGEPDAPPDGQSAPAAGLDLAELTKRISQA